MTDDDRQQPNTVKEARPGAQRGGPRPAARTSHVARSTDERLADHAAIDRLTEDFVPALIVKLSTSGLGEIEVGEGGWTVRVRRVGEVTPGFGRRLTDKPSRQQPGHAGHGHAPGGFEGHRSARETKPQGPATGTPLVAAPSNGSGPGTVPDASPAGVARAADGADRHRAIATSPAVGVFHPKPEITAGTRVRNGDRLGAVDMLGVPQDVVAPTDGILGASLVEAGQAVEYGQELIVIELAGTPADRSEG